MAAAITRARSDEREHTAMIVPKGTRRGGTGDKRNTPWEHVALATSYGMDIGKGYKRVGWAAYWQLEKMRARTRSSTYVPGLRVRPDADAV